MRNKFTKIRLAAGISLAMAFILSCSSSDDGEDEPYYNSKGGDIANYRIVRIGDQVWMAENLDYKVSGSKCFNGDIDYCVKYGRLYDWKTALTICPKDWHLPSVDEWAKLIDYIGADEAGIRLKSSSGWSCPSYKCNGTDDYGFSALPGGYGGSNGYYGYGGGFWWTASETELDYFADYALCQSIFKSESEMYVGTLSDKTLFLSVRCVQD